MRKFDQHDQNNGRYAFLLFLVWPLLSLASSIKNYREPWAKNILWAFSAFYGFSFAVGAENSSADIVRYIAHYESLAGMSLSFGEMIAELGIGEDIDILTDFIAVILSRFTDSSAVLTLVYGIIFGFFLSRNIWYILDRLEGKLKWITILLLVSFFLLNPIWNLNGFRMWTAAHIFLYGLFPFIFEQKKKSLLICAASIFVHFAFIVPVGIFLLYLILGNRTMIYFGFFVSTIFVAEIDLEVFNRLVEAYAPEALQEQTAGYRNEEYVEAFREGGSSELNWYVIWYGKAITWSIMGFLIMLFFWGRSVLKKNKRWLRLFCFTLLFYGFANILSSLPSGGRFVTVANMLALALVIPYIQNRDYSLVMTRFVYAATPALLLYILVAVRIGLYSVSATSILGNPIIAFFFIGENISLNDLLKDLVGLL